MAADFGFNDGFLTCLHDPREPFTGLSLRHKWVRFVYRKLFPRVKLSTKLVVPLVNRQRNANSHLPSCARSRTATFGLTFPKAVPAQVTADKATLVKATVPNFSKSYVFSSNDPDSLLGYCYTSVSTVHLSADTPSNSTALLPSVLPVDPPPPQQRQLSSFPLPHQLANLNQNSYQTESMTHSRRSRMCQHLDMITVANAGASSPTSSSSASRVVDDPEGTPSCSPIDVKNFQFVMSRSQRDQVAADCSVY